jgi:hypothetical protein
MSTSTTPSKAAASGMLSPNKGGKTSTLYKKYAKSMRHEIDPNRKLRPSEFNREPAHFNVDEYPKIIELNNMADNTAQVNSTVDMDQPLFQPSPKVVIFDEYTPFSVHEQKLFFRNNDSVSLRTEGRQCVHRTLH